MGRTKGEGRVYIAGPMRGIPLWNFPAFDEWRDFMYEAGWYVISPADMDRDLGIDEHDYPDLPFTMEDAMSRDIEQILSCTAILLLPGWENSTGVATELTVAKAIGLQILRAVECGDGTPLTYTLFRDTAQEAFEERLGHSMAQAEAGDLYSPLEVRIVDPNTGGEKGSKLARFDLIPPDVMWELAEHYGRGCQKYADRNWEKGYKWGLSLAAAERHLNLWKQGIENDDDPVIGVFPHLIAAIWHLCALRAFENRHLGTDDRNTDAGR